MSHIAPHANSFETSLFCQRLKTLADEPGASISLKNLCTATERLMSCSEAISSRVIEHLPQFTLHDGTHLWNVLSFMEELAGGKKAIAKLGAGDCAMAVWACFIHDLGMVLEATELAALDAEDHCDLSAAAQGLTVPTDDQRVKDWRAYRDGHEHWEDIRKGPRSETSRMRLGIIRAAFVRDTHARIDTHTGHCRIADWLAFLQDNDRLIAQALDDFALSKRIVPVAVSHNQDIAWLPRQLETLMTRDRVHAENLGHSLGTIHWTWIGWLLRLADVFDCDASRTPRILFDRITDHRSRNEWRKHLAIPEKPEWQAGKDDQTLAFTCQRCPGPDVEKAIHQIIGWMNDEIGKCHAAMLDTPGAGRLLLSLPSRASVSIIEREGDYLYQDIEFRLDRDAVVELLMGESLYGGPELALRELVQNALDAVHLRDVRNQLATAIKQAGSKEKPRQPHQHWEPGETGRVNVTWGTDPKKGSWIKVKDNGVGMTIGTMRRFLTQIGKSYYKSDDFRAEQELMREHGIVCTAISQFGIGFLSVFMLADRVEVHTRPLSAQDQPPPRDREDKMETKPFPFRAEINGPHGLLAFYPDASVQDYGTTVTLWLKEKFILAAWDEGKLFKQLMTEFYEPIVKNGYGDRFDPRMNEKQTHNVIHPSSTLLDPAFEVCRYVVWPRDPVILETESSSLTLDETFHFTRLAPLEAKKVSATANKWDCSIPELETLHWQAVEWVDIDNDSKGYARGSGARIRIMFPSPGATGFEVSDLGDLSTQPDMLPSGSHRILLGAFAEPSIPAPEWRYQCLVNGIRIFPGFLPSSQERDCRLIQILENLPILPGSGSWVWIDLRGNVMPLLRADRSGPVTSQQDAWSDNVSQLFQRWQAAWPEHVPAWIVGLTADNHLASKGERWEQGRDLIIASRDLVALAAAWTSEQSVISQLLNHLPGYEPRRLPRHIGVYRHSQRTCTHKLDASLEAALEMATCLPSSPAIHVKVFNSIEEANQWSDKTAPLRTLGTAVMQLISDEICKAACSCSTLSKNLPEAWSQGVRLHVCSQALWPTPERGHPMIAWRGLAESISELYLTGPLRVSNKAPTALGFWMNEYDLVFPFTAFAMPRLKDTYLEWMSDEAYRNILTLPFLLGVEPTGWRIVLEQPFPLSRLMLFMPNPEHYEWLFAEHTAEEWSQGSGSALWDLTTGEVIYADGVHNEASLRAQGKPLHEWLGIN
ncbi:MAG: ATP-binding protein [Verrucomicrobiaceae bacterium]|nr:ATP-binding protein [Verrucomicrobiaceae bacterium]